MSSANNFQYEPLSDSKEEIRLLRPIKGKPLSFTLEHFHRRGAPPYRALSYTWGKTDSQRLIEVNGKDFAVYPNLYDFLAWYPEHLPAVDYIWIDQISIDQATVSERNHQVSSMGLIYGGAEQVITWLGADPYIGAVLKQVEHWHSLGGAESAEAEDFLRQDELNVLPMNAHPYWSRAWIVQEVCLADDVLVAGGGQTLPWDIFASFTIFWTDKDWNMIKPLVLMRYEGPLAFPDHFYEILQMFYTQECQDARDKVFALQNLLPSSSEERVVVDYTKSVERVFVDVVGVMRLNVDDAVWLSWFLPEMLPHVHERARMRFIEMHSEAGGLASFLMRGEVAKLRDEEGVDAVKDYFVQMVRDLGDADDLD